MASDTPPEPPSEPPREPPEPPASASLSARALRARTLARLVQEQRLLRRFAERRAGRDERRAERAARRAPAPAGPVRRSFGGVGKTSVFAVRAALEVASVVVVTAAAVVFAAVLWLLDNPVEASFLGAPVERALESVFPGHDVSIDSMRIFWTREPEPSLRIVALGLQLRADDGALLGRLERAEGLVVSSLAQWAQREIVVRGVELDGLVLPMVVSASGLALAEGEESDLFGQPLAAPDGAAEGEAPGGPAFAPPAGRFSFNLRFEGVALNDATVILQDELGVRLAPPLHADLALSQRRTGFRLQALLRDPAPQDGAVANDLELEFVRRAVPPSGGPRGAAGPPAEEMYEASLRFSGLWPDRWYGIGERLWRAYSGGPPPTTLALGEDGPTGATARFLTDLEMSLAGAAEATFSGGAAQSVQISLSGSPGRMAVPGLYAEPMEVLAFGLSLEAERGLPEAGTEAGDAPGWQGRLQLDDLLPGSAEDDGDLPTLRGGWDFALRPARSLTAEGTLEIEDLSLAWLERLWPESWLETGRGWVFSHVHDATFPASEAAMRMSWRASGEAGERPTFAMEGMEVGFGFSGMSLSYLSAFPEVTEMEGDAAFTPGGMVFRIASAQSGGLALSDGSVRLTPHEEDGWRRTRLDVATGMAGAIADGFAILDGEELRFLSRNGIPSAGVVGSGEGVFRLSLPIKSGLSREDVTMEADVLAKDYDWPGLVQGLALSGEAMEVAYRDRGGQIELTAEGRGRVSGDSPVDFTWRWRDATSDTGAGAGAGTSGDGGEAAETTLQAASESFHSRHLAAFGLPLDERLEGRLSGTLNLRETAEERLLVLDAGLEDLAIDIPELRWRKERGAPGRAEMTLRHDRATGAVYEVRIDRAVGEGFDLADGRVVFTGGEAGLRLARFAEAAWGGNTFTGLSVERQQEDGAAFYAISAESVRSLWLLRGEGGEGRLEADVEKAEAQAAAEAEAAAEAAAAAAAAEAEVEAGAEAEAAAEAEAVAEAETEEEGGEKKPPVPIHLAFDRIEALHFAPQARLEDASLRIVRDGEGGYREFFLEGEIPRDLYAEKELREEEAAAEQDGAGGGEETDATDAAADEPELPPRGRVRIAYDAADAAGGGGDGRGWDAEIAIRPLGAGLRALGLTGGVEGGWLAGGGQSEAPWPQAPLPLSLSGRSLVLRDLNAFVQLLSLISLTGTVATLAGEGVAFAQMDLELTVEPEAFVVRDFHLSGERVGITASGRTGLDGSGTDIQGAIVPAYLFNRLIANIPLIGTLLSGGESREGVFAVNYQARGNLADPELSANPLTIVSPGLLRRLFGGGARGEPDGEESPSEAGEASEEGTAPAP